jgi:hypothetical protein
LIGQSLDDMNHVAGARAGGGIPDQRGRGVHVVAHHHHGAADVFAAKEGAERHHFAEFIADLELLHLGDLRAIVRIGHQVPLPRPPELIEQIDAVTAHVDLERVEDVGDWHAERLALRAIDIEEDLRRVGAKHGEHAEQPWVAAGLFDERVGHLLQLLQINETALLDLQLESTAAA